MKRKEPLTKEGLHKIVSIKSVLNLKSAFPQIVPAIRPPVKSKQNMDPNLTFAPPLVGYCPLPFAPLAFARLRAKGSRLKANKRSKGCKSRAKVVRLRAKVARLRAKGNLAAFALWGAAGYR